MGFRKNRPNSPWGWWQKKLKYSCGEVRERPPRVLVLTSGKRFRNCKEGKPR